MKKNKKIVISAFVGIFVVVALIVNLKFFVSGNKKADVTYTAKREKYENVIDVSGTVSAAMEQSLQALSSGAVTKVYVKAGDFVKKGDIIIQLDNSEQLYNLEKQDYLMAQKRVSGSERELKLMESERRSLQRKVQDRKIVASFDGFIADLDVAVGDSLNAKDIVGTIVNADYLITEVEVTETDVSKLEVGLPVEFKFPAYAGGIVTGYVTGWPAIGEITSRGATVVKVKIRIDDYPEEILPNYSFTGKIKISPVTEFVVVDKNAIGYDENKKAYVVDAKSGEKIYVTAEAYGRNNVKVTSGLEGGEILKDISGPAVPSVSAKSSKAAAPAKKSGVGGLK